MSEHFPMQVPQGFGARFGGFSNAYEQYEQATMRGMEVDASTGEMEEYDQMNRDLSYAEYFGYPPGTPSKEIEADLIKRHREGNEQGPMAA